MNRINQRGMDLIQYKEELLKEYPKIVRDSLNLSLHQLVENDALDNHTLLLIQDTQMSVSNFEQYLYESPSYLKTEKEIFAEYEMLRESFVEVLEQNGLGDLTTETIVQKDCILANKQFAIDEAFTKEYFGVNESDVLKLMKRRGFVEKFAVLRLTAIFNEFSEGLKKSKPELNSDLSLVYYDKEANSYAIDLFFEVPVELIEENAELPDRCLAIRTVVEQAEALFVSKTTV